MYSGAGRPGRELPTSFGARAAPGWLLDKLPIGVYCCDAEGRVVQFNRRAADIWGLVPEIETDDVRFCGSHRLFLTDGTPLPHDETPMRAVLRTALPVRDRVIVIERPDGSRVSVLVNIDPVFDAEGQLVGAVNCFQDISELRRAQEALAAKERHLHALLDALPAAIYTTDAEGRVTFYNNCAAEFAGRGADKASQRWCVSERLYWPDGTPLPHDECPMAQAIREQRPVRGAEVLCERPDGTRVPCLPHPTPLFDETGRLIGAVNMLVDITLRKQTEESQRLLIGELNHRVKNTLAIVQSIANQTLRRARSPYEFVASFSGRLQALSRAHTLLTETAWSGTELGALVRDQLLIDGSDGQRVTCSGPAVGLDPQTALHLALVLHELGTNARKYGALSVPGGRLHIDWQLRSGAERTLILHWQERDGPPVSAPETRGFGTSLIEKSLEAHGGQVHLCYAAHGLVCEILLPLPERARPAWNLPDSGRPGGRRGEAAALPANHIKGRRVLIVEDEPLIAMEMVASLEDAGCIVVGPASTREWALHLIDGGTCEAALVDANLAGEPVDDIAAALTRHGVPFSFVTGFGRSALPRSFREAPILAKPFTTAGLIATVRAVLADPGRPPGLRQVS